jgi:fumarylacetoacetate (FAA) hydrolase
VPKIAYTMQFALDNWDAVSPRLRNIYKDLNDGTALAAEPFVESLCHSPLPRAYQWADGSAYINHVELVRKARNADVPASFYTDPLMYQGGSDSFIGPRDPIYALDEDWGIDLEAEVAVITGDVGWAPAWTQCASAIRLVMLVNDVSLRNLIPGELAKGFGFSSPRRPARFRRSRSRPMNWAPPGRTANWPAADGDAERLPFGKPNAGEDMTFNFAQLVAHAAKTRELAAGTIIGSGTVSNKQGGLYGSSIEQWRRRLLLPGRSAHVRNHREGRADHAVPQVRRQRAHRDDGRRRRQHLRRHRPEGRALPRARQR